MSKPPSAAMRRKNSRFEPQDFADMLAPKGGAAGAVTGTEARSLAVAGPAPERTTASPNAAVATRKRFATSLDFPDYVDDQITAWLRDHPEDVFRTMILRALTKIGFEVKPEDLVPLRRRRR